MQDIINKLLGEQANTLSEDAQKTILESIKSTVDAKVNEIVEEKIQLALEADGRDKGEKLQSLVEKFEAKHQKELDGVIEEADETSARNLTEMHTRLEEIYTDKIKVLEEEIDTFKNTDVRDKINDLTNKLDAFIDTHIEEVLPDTMIEEMARRDHNQNLLNEISKIVGISNISEEVQSQVEIVKEENEQLKREINLTKKAIMLEEKCKGVPADIGKLVTEAFKSPNKTVGDIEDNFDLLVKVFEKQKDTSIQEEKKALNKTTINKFSKTTNDRTPQPQLLSESNKNVGGGEKGNNSMMSGWVDNLNAGLGSNDVRDDFWKQFD